MKKSFNFSFGYGILQVNLLVKNFCMEKKIYIKDTLYYAWEIFKANPVQHILVMLAVFIISQFTSILIERVAGSDLQLLWLLNLLDFLTIGALTSIFLFVYSILQTRKSDEGIQDMLSSIFDLDMWWKYITANILSTIAVVVGLILFIVPGIILGLGLIFASYYVVDYKESPIDALKKSWALTNGHKLTIFALILILIVINVLGALALFIGLLVTMPISMFAVAHVYNVLTDAYGEDKEQDDEDSDEQNQEDKAEEEDEEPDQESKDSEQDDSEESEELDR